MKGVEADYADSGSAKIETRVLPSWRGRQGIRGVDSGMRLKAIEAEAAKEAVKRRVRETQSIIMISHCQPVLKSIVDGQRGAQLDSDRHNARSAQLDSGVAT